MRRECMAGTAAAAMAALSLAAPVPAAEVQTGAAAACRSALPAFDGAIRTRPLAVQNEGAAPAFVSCSNSNGASSTAYHVTVAGVYVKNQNAAATAVACTLVTERLGEPNVYLTKTQTFAPGASGFIIWSTADNGGSHLSAFVNFSCSLAPGIGVSRIGFMFPGPSS